MKILAKIVSAFNINVTIFSKEENKIKIFNMIKQNAQIMNTEKFIEKYKGKCLTNIKMSDIIIINYDTIMKIIKKEHSMFPQTYFLIDNNVYASFIEEKELKNQRSVEVLRF